MKVLVLSCNTGQGHNAAGLAVCEALERRGVAYEFLDTLTLAGKTVSRKVSKTYVFITTKCPQVFGAMYHAGDFISSNRHKSPIYYVNQAYKKKLYRYIKMHAFDAVVMPHLFPAEVITGLKKDEALSIKSIAVATDYTCIPFWEETNPDYFIVPHTDLADEFAAHGIPADKLLPFGIPVSGRFRSVQTKQQAREALGLPQDLPMILIMSGSMGFGRIGTLMEGLLKALAGPVQIVVLGGNNEKLKRTLRTQFKDCPTINIVDFTDQAAVYMRASDLLYTKPGGLTSTEAAVCNVPVVFTNPIPGCETKNASFFKQRGMAFSSNKTEEQVLFGKRLLEDSAAREAMLLAQRENLSGDAAERIVDLLLNME